ncbi:PAS domain-containing protein [Pedobacter sp. ISL-68]|uniref:sensor histidine kinase n=1 Tax=unclassified Pedobacter TaxID=2628915 RepID=UPI001BE87035|nr:MULTISPECIES: ATP-binding protein [unclassified Pedobacter]MBT2560818.1 PAS domain-containing protein [Pedobacter sp. ISL-64]MBT2590197.1 PAS domain-containing protein [Pedobacter sp. ISL-68]
MTNKTDQIHTLIELNDELENYFRNTIIPQLFVDAQLILRKFTPPAMKQFSLALTDVGRPIADIKENFRFPAIIDNIQHVIDTGEILEKEIQTTDMRWYQMNILPYRVQKENKTNGVIITFVEVTRRIQDLKEQEKLIAEHEILLDTISHDIKTPLTSLSLTIEMLKKVPEKGMERFPVLLEKVENSLLNMQQIINDLTSARRINHKYQAEEELINFEHILEDVRLTLAPLVEESRAVIKSEINFSEIVFVRRKLRSLVYNLVNNAIKYASPERRPEILIATEKEDEYMVISITDNGTGIAEKDLKSIFTKYHRLNDSVEGSGVGLYLVNEIVNNSGGKITVESELGKGTVFKVFLKAAAQS